MQAQELILQIARLLIRPAVLVFQGNAGAICQAFHRLAKIDGFKILHKREYIATLVAAKTMKELFLGIDVETGGFFFMERTKCLKIRSGALQRHVPANDIHDVTGVAHPFNCRL